MHEAALVRRLMGLTVSVAQARRTFPTTPPGLFYGAAPPGDRRVLTFAHAFRTARKFAEQEAREARLARVAAARAAEAEERRAAAVSPALDYIAAIVGRELDALRASLVARSASSHAIQTLELVKGRCARQAASARSRIAKRGGADDRPS